jgi:uncharacterized membrane-anchored protein YjiN (DUF445 family)
LKRTTTAAAGDPHSELRVRMQRAFQQLGQRLLAEQAMRDKVDDWVSRAVAHLVDNYRGEVANLISSTVERWDADATSARMELQVGRDLQFIRINGTVVGGIAGVVIYALSSMVF